MPLSVPARLRARKLPAGNTPFTWCPACSPRRQPDPPPVVSFILSSNIQRRHLTKGQRAMAVAKICSVSEQSVRSAAKDSSLSATRIANARTVLKLAPDHADAVRAGHKRQQCGPRPQKFGCRTLRGTRLIGCRKCRARQRPVRIPRHDGHDSGLMVDSVPAGWRTISLRRRTSHSRAAGQGSAAEFSVSGRPPRPAPARPGATVQVRLPNFCARCGGAE